MNYSEYKKNSQTIHNFWKDCLYELKVCSETCARASESRAKKVLLDFNKDGIVVKRHNYLTVWFNLKIQIGYIKTDIDYLIKKVNPRKAATLLKRRKACLKIINNVCKAILNGTCVSGGIQ